jgi:hypothetical protein
MPTQDDFDSTQPPAFLLADRQDAENTPDRPAISSRVFKAIALIAVVTAIGAAALSVEDPMMLLANVTAPLVGNSGPQPESEQSTATVQPAAEAPASIQSAAAEAQPVAQTTKEGPTQGQVQGQVAVAEPANEPASEKIEPASEDLFRKFQAWAADKDAQSKDAQSQDAAVQPVEDAPVQGVKRVARVPHRLVPRQPRVYPVRNARAEVRSQAPRKRVRPEPPPTSDPRVQDPSVQTGQPQSFLSTFGLRN